MSKIDYEAIKPKITQDRYGYRKRGVLHYEFEIEYTDSKHGCTCEDYCRCGTIEDARVERIKTLDLVTRIVNEKYRKDPMLMYAVERMISLNLKPEDCEVMVDPGYYGQEIGGVIINDKVATELVEKLKLLESCKTDAQMMEIIMTEEYGVLLPNVENKLWAVEIVDINDLKATSVVKKQFNHYNNNDNFQELLNWGEEFPVVVINAHNQIIDGHHRINALKNKTGYKPRTYPTKENHTLKEVMVIKVKGDAE